MVARVRIKTKKAEDVLARALVEIPEAFAAAVYQEAALIFAESQRRVPVDTGTLRRSGGLSPPIQNAAGDVKVEIFYGTEYAYRVHEDHKSRSQYLKAPFMEAMSGLAKRIAVRTKKNIASRVGAGVLPEAEV